jgi:hypothetical protein
LIAVYLSAAKIISAAKSSINTEKSKIHEHNSDLSELSFAQMEVRCYCCAKTGHKSPKCNDKNKKEKNGISTRLKRLKFKGSKHM